MANNQKKKGQPLSEISRILHKYITNISYII